MVFTSQNPYNLKKGLQMEDSCNKCKLTYEREPGFFYGAMYVTYALIVAWIVILFALAENFLELSNWTLIGGMMSFLLLIVPINFRLSRLFWLNFFVRYKENGA
jgi:uncharacterized protein (DUF983 family)